MRFFEFDGVSSEEFGTYVTASNMYDSPEEDVDILEIPYSNKFVGVSRGTFKPFKLKVTCLIYQDIEENLERLRNFLQSRGKACVYKEYPNDSQFRIARYRDAFVVRKTEYDHMATFVLEFDCWPHRYMTRNTIIDVEETATTSTSPFLTTTKAPLRITLRGPATGTNTIKITNKNISGELSYYNSSNYSKVLYLPAGDYALNVELGEVPSGLYVRQGSAITSTAIKTVYSQKQCTFTVATAGDYFIQWYKSGFTDPPAKVQLERGSTYTAYEEHQEQVFTIRLGELTLTSSDSIIKSSGKWYVHNSTDTEITDADLIEDLNAIEKAVSYNGQTNILQSGFTITTTSLNAEEVPSAHYTEPVIQANETGYIVINDEVIEVLSAPVTINCQTMQCYNGNVNMNNQVKIDNFPVLNKGQNSVACDMPISITPNYWEL